MFPILSEYNSAPDGFHFGTGRTDDVISLESIRCSTRIGGLLKSYSRKAA
jgi:hypothetical protein